MRAFLEEFKNFISRGNALDLAVGVVIGGAFGKIVTSFVADLFTPVLGLIIGGVNFQHLAGKSVEVLKTQLRLTTVAFCKLCLIL